VQDNIKANLRKRGYEVGDWIRMAQMGPMAGPCAQGNEHLGCIKRGEFLT